MSYRLSGTPAIVLQPESCLSVVNCADGPNWPVYTPTQSPTRNPLYSPTLTGPELDATKMAPEIEARKTVDAEATNYALGTPFRIFPTTTPDLGPTSTREPLATPILGINNACVEPSISFNYGGCWNGTYAGEYLFVAAGASITNPDLGQVQIYTATLDLYSIGALQIFSAPVEAGKLSIANVYWPNMTLVTHQRGQQPDTTFTFNLLTHTWEESGPCQIYPLALHEQTIATGNGQPYLTIEYGRGSSNFGWLTWDGDLSANALAAGLTPPGESNIYINPNDPSDHSISIGDWVIGRPEVNNEAVVENALANLKVSRFKVVVPIWDQVMEQGSDVLYHISDFAWIYSIQSFSLSHPNRITFAYWGQARCETSP